MEQTVNITLKLHNFQITEFESWLRHEYDVIGFKIVPDTNELYKTDKYFQKLVKAEKQARELKEKYINEKNI